MSRYVMLAIPLLVLLALPLVASSPPLIHTSHPMVPGRAPPGVEAAVAKSGGCSLPITQCFISINWSGYAVLNATNSVTWVGATWVIPAIAGASGTTCPDPDFTWLDAAIWVGIDGAINGYVEQTGTSVDCVYGHANYYPWYEFYPALSYPLPSVDKVYPGDTMYAYVNYTSPPFFGIWLQDKTPGHAWAFSLLGENEGAPRDSAEWITEGAFGCITSDCSLGNFLALTDFTSVTFNNAIATVVCPGCVVPGTYTFPVSSASWGASVLWIALTNVFYPPPGPFLRAIPNTATDGGKFTVKWVSSGP